MSSRLHFAIVLTAGLLAAGAAAEEPQLSQIQKAIDSGSSRSDIRDTILKITADPVPTLAQIVRSEDDPDSRRRRALALLGTFPGKQSEDVLDQIADGPTPFYRCLALHSLAELNSPATIGALIRKLDDQAVCMKTVVTDPAREYDVYVSDEAVRLLEEITGRSFERASIYRHRDTKPWKKWWAKQKKPPPALADTPEERWLNLPGTPLSFTLLANGYTLALTNVSTKLVQELSLGCVDRASGKVTRKLRIAAILLERGKSSFGDLESYGGDFAACTVSHSVLSVIGVTFADGSSWKYEPGPPS